MIPNEAIIETIIETTCDAEAMRRFMALARRISSVEEMPAPADVRALRQILADTPGLWRYCGDIAQQALTTVIEAFSRQPLYRESVASGMAELRRELGAEQAAPLERLLIEQVVLCYLRLNLFEYQFTLAMRKAESEKGIRFWEGSVTSAQRRYLRACETLARVRRLARRTPDVMQINVAGQQVNLVGRDRGGG